MLEYFWDFEKMGFLDTSKGISPNFCPGVKKSFKWRVLYFLYGGHETEKRMPIIKQFVYLFTHPIKFFKMLGKKIYFVLKPTISPEE